MRPKISASDSKGFTLIELMVVVAIIAVIAVVAIPLFQNFLKKAKMVEGEQALTEIKRLEEHYYAENLQFTDNLSTLGFNPTSPLAYYTITIQLNGAGPPPFFYQATATGNVDNDPDLDVWVLTVYSFDTYDLKHGCIPGGVGAVDFTCTD